MVGTIRRPVIAIASAAALIQLGDTRIRGRGIESAKSCQAGVRALISGEVTQRG